MQWLGVDEVIAALLTGRTKQKTTALYYTAFQNGIVEPAYRQFLDQITDMSDGFKLPENFLSADDVGTRIRPTLEAVSAFIDKLHAFAERQSNLEGKHNAVVACLWATASVLTGHRPVIAPFDLYSDVDALRGANSSENVRKSVCVKKP